MLRTTHVSIISKVIACQLSARAQLLATASRQDGPRPGGKGNAYKQCVSERACIPAAVLFAVVLPATPKAGTAFEGGALSSKASEEPVLSKSLVLTTSKGPLGTCKHVTNSRGKVELSSSCEWQVCEAWPEDSA